MKIAVAIPAFNCQNQLLRMLEQLDLVLSIQYEIETVMIFDNRSTDNTLQEALTKAASMRNSAKIKVYRNLENAGLGGTHKIAFTIARAMEMTHLLILHGDHQSTPYDIPKLIKRLKKETGKTVLGSRFSNLSNLSGYSIIRTLGNLGLNVLYSLFTFKKVTDLGSGLNIFEIAKFQPQDLQNFDNGFTFNMDILLYMIRKKINFVFEPITWTNTDQISNAKSLQVGAKAVVKLYKWLFRKGSSNKGHAESELLR